MKKVFTTYRIVLVVIALLIASVVKANPTTMSATYADVKCGAEKTFTVADVTGASYSWKLVDEKTGDIFKEMERADVRNIYSMTMPEEEGFYILTVIADLEGCKQEIESRLLASKIALSVTIDGEDWLCESQERVLEAIVSSDEVNEDEISYVWFHDGVEIKGEENKYLKIQEEGLYEVKVKAVGSEMVHTATKEYDVPKEIPYLETEETAKLNKEADIEIGNNADWDNEQGYTYEWSLVQEGTTNEIVLAEETGSTISLSKINKAGIFTVKASNEYCTSTANINVIRWFNIGISTAFSPENGEFLNVLGNQEGIEKISLLIYNRDGLKMFETTNMNSAFNKGWDGRYNGVVQPIDGYVYFLAVTFDDGEVMNKKGSISLLK